MSQLSVSLKNGPKAFVITGPSKVLFGFVTSLRKIKSPSCLDQGKVPFSHLKPVFSIMFLVVGMPYHSQYLASATEKLIEEDLEGEELGVSRTSRFLSTTPGTVRSMNFFQCMRTKCSF
jgi:fatty acid synthase subunit beta